jgi:hypothetical protein
MILIDLNQAIIAGLMMQVKSDKKSAINEDLVRHMAINIIRTHVKNFKKDYGEVVICCDNRNYWRKQYFPYYKAGRKKSREKSTLDWHLIFDILNKIKEEIKVYFPYKVIDVESAEADDIIGTLAPRYVASEDVMIVSSDGDFIQLQMYNQNSKYSIKQYSPILKKMLKSDNPHRELKEKIICGDKGDGIPNILSSSDCFVLGKRQTSIYQEKLEKMLDEDVNLWTDEHAKIGYSRNKTLIDLREIPSDIKNKIIEAYDTVVVAPRSNILNYFIEKRLKNLIETLGDF